MLPNGTTCQCKEWFFREKKCPHGNEKQDQTVMFEIMATGVKEQVQSTSVGQNSHSEYMMGQMLFASGIKRDQHFIQIPS